MRNDKAVAFGTILGTLVIAAVNLAVFAFVASAFVPVVIPGTEFTFWQGLGLGAVLAVGGTLLRPPSFKVKDRQK